MLSTFKQFDAFPKLEPSSLKQTTIGGLISLSVYISIVLLSLWQVWTYFSTTTVEYSNFVDRGTSGNVTLRVDMIVATSCGKLEISSSEREITRHFTLTPHHQTDETANPISRDPLLQFLASIFEQQIGQYSCRIQGTIDIPKHPGTLRISPRKIPIAPNVFLVDPFTNFSHKIISFSFGSPSNDSTPSFNAMEKNIEVAVKTMQKFTYNLCIVPTQYEYSRKKQLIYQHALTQYSRPASRMGGESGIVVNYEFDPLSLHVRVSRGSMRILLIRFLGIVAGLFATSKIMHSLLIA
jgi:hypothetical protein